ncbi:MAG: MoaD/ThiS family protein [Verrucomicrobia bacterium]|nr:MoaD/ThiS family protein [Verrucomicrobiota bacterium]
MPVKIRIPAALRALTDQVERVDVAPGTVGSALAELRVRYPGLQERLFEESGALRRFVNVYANEEDIRFLERLATPLRDGDELSIIPAIAGG